MGKIPVEVGKKVSFSKTVGETDIYMYAGISGDFAPNHVNEEYMKNTRYGQRIAHGAMMVGFFSTCSSLMVEQSARPSVSYGYDRIRFTGPVFIGDTVTVEYVITKVMEEEDKTLAEIKATKQDGTVVAVGSHILKFVG